MHDISRKKAIILYILSFIIPAAVVVFAFALRGVYPFGDNTAVTGDAAYQFIDFVSYLKTVFGGDNDFVYSLSKNLGGAMAGFSAYYHYSVLNLLTLFFPADRLPEALFLIFSCGAGLCSLGMFYCLGRLKGVRAENLIFSYAYGLMGFLIVYIELFEYYTDIILLPLVYLGLKRMIDERKINPLYIVSLTLSIICNYYFGYMICIFCVLIFLYEILLDLKKIKSFVPFAVSSAVSGGMSAFVVLPAVLSLSGEKSNLAIGWFFLFNPLDFFSKFFTGSFKGDFGTGLPNVYCGMLSILLVCLFFFNKRISTKEKIVTGVFCIFFWVNFCINTLNVIWHGFNQPIGYPQRFAYLFVFFLLIKAFEAFNENEGIEGKKAYIISALIFAVYSVYLLLSRNANTYPADIAVSAVFFALSLALLYLRPKRMIMLLLFVMVVDLGANAVMTFRHFGLITEEEYRVPVRRMEEMTGYLKERDQGLYRIEKYFRRSHNDPFMHGYAGLSHYSSSEKMSTIRYMGRLGFRDNGNWAYYGEGNTTFADSLLGVKYVLSQFEGTGKPYEKIHETNEGYSIFENPYVLPLLFATKTDRELEDFESYDDPFCLQEDIADSITGRKNEIFTPVQVIKTYEDERKAVFSLTPERDGMLVAYLDAPREQKANLYFNGADIGEYFSTYRWNVLDLGYRTKGNTIEISVEASADEDIQVTGAYFYNENYDALEAFYDEVSSEKCSIEKITSSHYRGSADISDGKGAVFSVPYDENWQVFDNGKRAVIYKACGNLLGVRLDSGKHDLEFKYVSRGQMAGNIISLISAVFIILYALIQKRKKK